MNSKEKSALDRARQVKMEHYIETFSYLFPEMVFFILPFAGFCLICIGIFIGRL